MYLLSGPFGILLLLVDWRIGLLAIVVVTPTAVLVEAVVRTSCPAAGTVEHPRNSTLDLIPRLAVRG